MKSNNKEKPWQDEAVLRELYHHQGMSMQDIADHFGDMTWGGIKYWMDKLGIERRTRSDAAKERWLKEHPKIHTDPYNGYESVRVEAREDVKKNLLIHRLLAVAVFGVDEVKGSVVHHKNNLPWDNRPSNIELMTAAEHANHHVAGRHDDKPWHDTELLHELRVEKNMSVTEMATELDCSGATVSRSLQEHRIGEYEES